MKKNTVLFAFPENFELAKIIVGKANFDLGDLSIREFPDKESFVQIFTDVKDRNVVILCGLDKPNRKLLPLVFLADLCRELGAKKVNLISPYLGYMRQDCRFNDGEAITSRSFAKVLNEYFDKGMTIDPHLHRYEKMSEIYKFPFKVLHAGDIIAKWIKENIKKPVLIGPDSESKQWVSHVAKVAEAPFMVLNKVRTGDRDVEVSVPEIEKYRKYTPVLVDDIISTARTMIEVVRHLNEAGMNRTVCIGIHAVFAGDGYEALKNAKVADVVTCNTIPHKTNKIDISDVIVSELLK
jgi:ribose-phosphate pyrophosphokinase